MCERVHSHGPEDGRGVWCPERFVDGQLKGDCMIETVSWRGVEVPVTDPEPLPFGGSLEPIDPEPFNTEGVAETVLEEAQRLVYGPRQASYGHPFDDFSKTGQMWGAILSAWRDSGDADVPPELVALCQIAVKISREVNAPKRDNVVDMAGYAGTLALVRERQGAQ